MCSKRRVQYSELATIAVLLGDSLEVLRLIVYWIQVRLLDKTYCTDCFLGWDSPTVTVRFE